MNYFDRAAQNSLIDQAVYFNARNAQSANTDSTGTVMGIDATTGRSLVVAGDGIARTKDIASSNQLAITSPFARGTGGNAGYNDGRAAN